MTGSVYLYRFICIVDWILAVIVCGLESFFCGLNVDVSIVLYFSQKLWFEYMNSNGNVHIRVYIKVYMIETK